MEPARTQLDIRIDLAAVQESAARVRGMLLELRERFDLSPVEYTKEVRIAPTEIPHSHPVLTLNTWVRDELGLLLMYVHEQMHWYATWYSHAHPPEWKNLMRRLHERYPSVPVGGRDGAGDESSSYLHLIVNWCEIDVAARFHPRDQVVARVRELPFYRWIYETVIGEWQALARLYADHGLVPIQPATSMSEEDLRLAARADDACA